MSQAEDEEFDEEEQLPEKKPMSAKEQLFYDICTRDNSECQCCGWYNEEHDKLWVKRIDPEGGLEPANLITLCTYCKDLKEELETTSIEKLKKEQRKRIYSDICRREGYRCKRCGYTDKTMSHIWVVRRYAQGSFSKDNMVALCFHCKERKEEFVLETDEELADDYAEQVREGIEPDFLISDRKPIIDGDENDWHHFVYGGKRNPKL